MRPSRLMVAVLGLLALAACGENRFDRGVTGAAIGAGTGVAAGAMLGPVGMASGALVGAGIGGVAGVATRPSEINLGRPIYR